MSVADGGKRRREHDTANPAAPRGSEHPQRSFSGRHDEFVFVGGVAGREGRRHVQHEVAARCRFDPAVVLMEVGGEEFHGLRRFGGGPADAEHRAHCFSPFQIAHGGPHAMPGGQQLEEGVATDEA